MKQPDTNEHSQLLCLSYPDILQYINKDGFITATNKKQSAISEDDVTLITEFIRAFLVPAEEPLKGTTTEHLHRYVTCWYNISLQQPVAVCKGAVILAMCKAGFTAYHSPGASDCLYNIRGKDVQSIYAAFAHVGDKVRYTA